MSTKKKPSKKPDRRLTFWNYWLAWISVNALAWLAGFALVQLYARLLYPNDSFIQLFLEESKYIWTRPLDSLVGTVNTGLMLGAAVGFGQWYVLRRRFDMRLRWWMAATMLGFALHGLLLGLEVRFLSGGQAADQGALASLGLLCGGIVVVGVPQWLVLRRYVARAGWWILASTVGLVLASPDRSGGTGSLAAWIVVSMGSGAVYGIVTAFALFFLISPAEEPLEEEGDETLDIQPLA